MAERRTAPTTFTTKRTAASWLAEVQTEIEERNWRSPEEVAAEETAAAAEEAAAITIRQLAEVWVATIPSANHKTMSASRVRRLINPLLGDVRITELTRARCLEWYAQLCPDAPTPRARTYAALHAMLGLAVDREMITVNPLRIKGATGDTPAREPQTATADEVDELSEAMPDRLVMAVELAAWCGLLRR